MGAKYTFHDLIVWQKAIELSKSVYQMTQRLPDEEKYGLVSQMRRAVVSVASNIAEGNARQTTREFLHFLSVARGSLAELETQWIITRELYPIGAGKELLTQIEEVRRLLQALMESLRRRAQES